MTGDDLTRLLADDALDDDARARDILPLVYDQLRRVAQERMNAERPGHTLQATALVHEAYLRLVGDRQIPWAGRGHFYAAAAEAMRRILIDHARAAGREKRGGGRVRELTNVAKLAIAGDSSEILSLDESVRRLERQNEEIAAVVRLRFFAGLSIADTAAALGLSNSTVKRRWEYARAWLYRDLTRQETGDDDIGATHD